MAFALDKLGAVISTSQVPTSTSDYAVGDMCRGSDGSTWVYVKATTALTQYDVAWIDVSGNAAPITPALALTAGRLGFAQVAFTVNYYGWVQLTGPATIRVAAACVAGVPLYTTDTAGVLDDATVSLSQHQVIGVVLSGSQSAGAAGAVAGYANSPTIRRPAV